MVHGLADETALAGLHAGDSERVSFSGAGLGLGPLALESAVFVLLFLLVGVFGGCGLGLRKELRVFRFVSLSSKSLPLANHL